MNGGFSAESLVPSVWLTAMAWLNYWVTFSALNFLSLGMPIQ